MKQKRILGITLTLVQTVTSVMFLALLYWTKLLPGKYLALLALVLSGVTLAVFLLTKNSKKKLRVFAGILTAVLVHIAYIVGAQYLIQGVNTLSNITKTSTEQADICVYVRKEDPAVNINDTAGYSFGVLEALDRENTDQAILAINVLIGKISTTDYEGITELADSLLATGETDAIIMNRAYLDLLCETEGYEEIEEQIREIHIEAVEKPLEAEQVIQEEDESGFPKVFTVFISGIDSRSGLVAKSRSDVNILATVNRQTRQVLLISTPRDYYVPLSISNGVPDKLTHAGIYGVDVCMDTLGMLYDTEIDYYFRVNFSGFEAIIDALGGITITSDYTFDSKNEKGYSFVKGENYVKGAAALAFVRERYAFAEGDRQRGRNQMAVIDGVIKKALSPALLKNYTKILKSVEGSFETSIPYDLIAELVRDQLDQGGTWRVESYSVDGSGAKKKPYSMSSNTYVMVPDYDTVKTASDMIKARKS